MNRFLGVGLLLAGAAYAQSGIGAFAVAENLDPACLAGIAPEQLRLSWQESLYEAGFAKDSPAPWIARIGLAPLNSGLCHIQVSLTPPEFGARPTETAQDFIPTDSLALYKLLKGASQALQKMLQKQYTGSLVLDCPVEAQARITGVADLPCPGSIGQIPPGSYAVRVSREGYQPIEDSVTIRGGETARKTYELKRSQAWLDSIAATQAGLYRDSLVEAAKTIPARSLPELFQRLFAIPLPLGAQAVAVLPFQTSGRHQEGYDPGVMAAEYATVQVSKDLRFRLVERAALDKVLSEQTMAQAGLVVDSLAAQSGRLLSAQYLVVGNVTMQGNAQFVFARLVHVESGSVVSAASAQVGNEDLRELYLESIGERTQVSSTVFRSLVAPGWGQFYAHRPVRGALWSALATGAIGYTVWRGLEFRDAQSTLDQYENHDPGTIVTGESGAAWLARANSAVDERNEAATQLNIALGVLGAVWLGNVLDAWWVGSQESRRIQTQYFTPRVAVAPVVAPGSAGILLAGTF